MWHGSFSVTLIIHVTPVAGSNFARGKKSSFPELFLKNLKFRKSQISGHTFDCVHSLGLWSGFKNPPNIWTALFEKETYKEKPPRLKCKKIPRIWRNNPPKWVLSISRDYWGYFEKVPDNLNAGESSENRESFSSSKFDPATGVTCWMIHETIFSGVMRSVVSGKMRGWINWFQDKLIDYLSKM